MARIDTGEMKSISKSSGSASSRGLDCLIGGVTTISRWFARLSGALVVLISVLVGVEVVLRALTDISMSFSHELSGYTLAIVSALSLAYALLCKAHIRIDIVYYKVSGKWKRVMDVVALAMLLGFSIVLLQATWEVFFVSFERNSVANTSLGTLLWVPQLVWVVGYALFAFVAALLLIRVLLAMRRGEVERAEYLVGGANSEL